jgi:hypothetical protein
MIMMMIISECVSNDFLMAHRDGEEGEGLANGFRWVSAFVGIIQLLWQTKDHYTLLFTVNCTWSICHTFTESWELEFTMPQVLGGLHFSFYQERENNDQALRIYGYNTVYIAPPHQYKTREVDTNFPYAKYNNRLLNVSSQILPACEYKETTANTARPLPYKTRQVDTKCPVGEYKTSEVDTKCPVGEYKTWKVDTKCPVGEYKTSEVDTNCAVGEYKNSFLDGKYKVSSKKLLAGKYSQNMPAGMNAHNHLSFVRKDIQLIIRNTRFPLADPINRTISRFTRLPKLRKPLSAEPPTSVQLAVKPKQAKVTWKLLVEGDGWQYLQFIASVSFVVVTYITFHILVLVRFWYMCMKTTVTSLKLVNILFLDQPDSNIAAQSTVGPPCKVYAAFDHVLRRTQLSGLSQKRQDIGSVSLSAKTPTTIQSLRIINKFLSTQARYTTNSAWDRIKLFICGLFLGKGYMESMKQQFDLQTETFQYNLVEWTHTKYTLRFRGKCVRAMKTNCQLRRHLCYCSNE